MRIDWLIEPPNRKSMCLLSTDGKEITLEKGLIRRVFRLKPNAATVSFDNLMTGQAMLCAVKPEASVELDGVPYAVGGLAGQPDLAYLRPLARCHALGLRRVERSRAIIRSPGLRLVRRACARSRRWKSSAGEGTPTAKRRQGRLREEGSEGSRSHSDDLTNRNSI